MAQLTKYALAQSLKKLLRERPLDKITVKDLVDDCGVNRQTFYYHFQDIYDLIAWTLNTDVEHILKEHGELQNDLKKQLSLAFHYFEMNRQIILNGFDPVNHMQYERIVEEYARVHLRKKLLLVPESAFLSEEEREAIIDIYANGFSGLFLKWIERGMPEEYHVKIEYYFILLEANLEFVIDRFLEAKKEEKN